ncbi:MAG: DUF5305 family protein [Salinigranum sp.]
MSLYLRSMRFLAVYGRPIVGVLVVVSVLYAFGAWHVYATPPTHQETTKTDSQTIRSSVGTSAVVTGQTLLYPRGAHLTDKPLYLRSATPNLTFTVDTAVPANAPVTVGTRLTLRHAAAYNGRTYWRTDRVLIDRTQTVSGGHATASTTINMSAVIDYLDRRRAETGDLGTMSSTLLLNVTYDTGRYAGTITADAPVVFTGNGYYVDGDLSASDSRSKTVTTRVVGSADPAIWGGLALLSLLSLAGAAGCVVLLRRGIDVRRIDELLARQAHDEWISNGELPTGESLRYVMIDSLEDLVDIAIDSKKRVIYDDDYDVDAVVDADVTYYYAAGDVQIDSWLDV